MITIQSFFTLFLSPKNLFSAIASFNRTIRQSVTSRDTSGRLRANSSRSKRSKRVSTRSIRVVSPPYRTARVRFGGQKAGRKSLLLEKRVCGAAGGGGCSVVYRWNRVARYGTPRSLARCRLPALLPDCLPAGKAARYSLWYPLVPPAWFEERSSSSKSFAQ